MDGQEDLTLVYGIPAESLRFGFCILFLPPVDCLTLGLSFPYWHTYTPRLLKVIQYKNPTRHLKKCSGYTLLSFRKPPNEGVSLSHGLPWNSGGAGPYSHQEGSRKLSLLCVEGSVSQFTEKLFRRCNYLQN